MFKRFLLSSLFTLLVFNGYAQPQVGIVLSGGGALGFAHIGALQALEEAGIHPTYVAGSSMGALVGAFYASGMTPKEIFDMVRAEKIYSISKIFSLSVSTEKIGISSHKNVNKLMDKYIPHNSFDLLPKHLYVSAVNLNTQKCEIVGKGNKLKEYVLASSSIAAVFEAIEINGDIYVDGGSLNNMPTEAIREKCDVVIGIDAVPPYEENDINNIKDVSLRLLNIITCANSVAGRKMCDFLVESFAVKYYTIFDFEKYEEIYNYGYSAMSSYINEHPEMIDKCSGKNK